MRDDQTAVSTIQQNSSYEKLQSLHNELIEQFSETLMDKSLGGKLREKLYQTMDQLQQELDSWFYDFSQNPDTTSTYIHTSKRPVNPSGSCMAAAKDGKVNKSCKLA